MNIRKSAWGMAACLLAGAPVLSQQPEGGATIKTETRLVLVDAVVTDKKGGYVRDLTRKDFRVWEDNQEQDIKSFSFEADPNSPNRTQRRYLVLFFDNSTMDFSHQQQARQAAGRFVDSNAGPNRMMAVVEYAGGLRITQNFTDDGVRLKQVVSGVKLAPQMGNDTAGLGGGIGGLNRAAAAYGARDVILALKSLVKNLASVPGRKSLVLMTSGFRLNQENLSELTELVDACNKANVAVYPIDARGLVAPTAINEPPVRPARQLASYVPAMAFGFQKPGMGGGGPTNAGAGSTTSSGTTGGRSGSTNTGTGSSSNVGRGGTTNTGNSNTTGGRTGTVGGAMNPNSGLNNPRNNPMNNPRVIMPRFPESASDNQQPLYMLASGTGGFVIVNTNDLLGGLEKIGQEQNEHYLIGYSPEESKDGSCHSLKVKVSKSGMTVRARTGYCNVKATDMLAGNPVEKDLEKLVLGSTPGSVKASMQVPYFYTSPNAVRMNIAMEIPSSAVEFKKQKGKYHSELNLLGIAYRSDGGVATRFSDTMKFDFENKKAMEAWQENQTSLHYEKDLEAAPGKYTLKVVVGSGTGSFGRLEMPVNIDAYDGKTFSLSGLALSSHFRKVTAGEAGLDSAMMEDRTPLVVSGMQITPSGRSHFKNTETVAVYAELYEVALLNPEPPKDLAAAIQLRVLDRQTGEVKQDSGLIRATEKLTPGNPVIPLGLKVPIDKLAPGRYNLELSAADTTGGKVKRVTQFDIE